MNSRSLARKCKSFLPRMWIAVLLFSCGRLRYDPKTNDAQTTASEAGDTFADATDSQQQETDIVDAADVLSTEPTEDVVTFDASETADVEVVLQPPDAVEAQVADADVFDAPALESGAPDADVLDVVGDAGAGEAEASTTDPLVQLSLGNYFSCGTHASGRVSCWGDNREGQLGDGTTSARTTPGMFALGLTDALSVAAGGRHACAKRNAGRLSCWGDNLHGQLGNGMAGMRTGSMQPVPVTIAGDVREVATGTQHTCVLLNDGTVWCWGENTSGELGLGDTMDRSTPTRSSALSNVQSLCAGDGYSCALLTDASVRCWGNLTGDGTTANRSTPVQVPGLTEIIQIACGLSHTCARNSRGQLWCWGNGNSGQLGVGTTANQRSPQQVMMLTNAQSIAAGGYHTCANSGGSSYCWGWGMHGQLGDGSSNNSRTPVRVMNAILDPVLTGAEHTCGRDSVGWKCWGANYYGELGTGAPARDALVPTAVLGVR